MRLLRTALAGIAAAFLFSAAPAQATPAPPSAATALAQAAPDLTQTVQYYGHRRGYYGGPHRYGYGYRPGYGWGAAAAGAAVGAGLAYGAYDPYYGYGYGGDYGYADTGAYAAQPDDAIAECARRFRTYDPASQTYVVRQGVRARCP